jgi:hypothetical protein
VNNDKNNYYRKLSDLNFRLKAFAKVHEDEQIYLFDLNSREKNLVRFKKRIWRPWRRRFFHRFKGKAIGAIECQRNGNWHIHLLVVLEGDYAASYVLKDIAEVGRRLWRECNLRANRLGLRKRGVFRVELPEDGTALKRIHYISKARKYEGREKSFIAKPFGQSGSFGVSHGVKGRGYWSENDLPSNKHSDAVLQRNYLAYLKKKTAGFKRASSSR